MSADPYRNSAGPADPGKFTYDGFGNLTDKTPTVGSTPALHVTVNVATNQISTSSGYGYDASGNLAGGQGFSASYDVQNRMATFVPTSGGTEYYSYGPDNMRVWKKTPTAGEEVYFYGAQGEKLGRFGYGTGVFTTLRRSVYFGARILTETQDRLGSWWDQGGYYPYGEAQNSGNNDFDKFATYYRDGKFGGATSGTSVVSKFLSQALPQQLPTALPTVTNAGLQYSKILGRVIRRWAPIEGYTSLYLDFLNFTKCVEHGWVRLAISTAPKGFLPSLLVQWRRARLSMSCLSPT